MVVKSARPSVGADGAPGVSSNSSEVGNAVGGLSRGTKHEFNCPNGEFINMIRGESEDRVDMIMFECTDYSASSRFGGGGGNRDAYFVIPEGIHTADVSADETVHGIRFNGDFNGDNGKEMRKVGEYGTLTTFGRIGCKAVGATVHSDKKVRAIGFNFRCDS